MRLAFTAVLFLSATSSAQVRAPLDAPLVVGDHYQQIVKTLDLNGDGWMDAFGWWTDTAYGLHPGQGFLHGWINDGAGNLSVAWTVPYTNSVNDDLPSDVAAVGDLDGDGDDDFVIATGTTVRVYLSNGASAPTLRFSSPGPGTSPTWIHCVALENVDGDPEPELLLAVSSILAIYDVDVTNGALLERTQVTTAFMAAGKLVVAELTGDGELDVLLTGTRIHPIVGGQLQPWAHNFALPWTFTSYDRRFDGGDVDGDGDFDLVAFAVPIDPGSPQYRIVRRTGPSTWSMEPPVNGGPARMLADIDGDGDLDGTCCGGGGFGSRSKNEVLSNFRVALNDGTGAFAASISIPSVGSKAIAGVADLDHDGDMDLVGGRCVMYAQSPLVENPSPILGAGYQHARTVVDLDGDADPDFEPRAGSIRWNMGNGPSLLGTLALPPAPAGLLRDGHPFPGDWDGDGDVDLMFRLTAQGGLELVLNRGSGHFESAGVRADATELVWYSNGAVNSLAEDLDGDGDLDLVLRCRLGFPSLGVKSGWWRNDVGRFDWQATWDGPCVSKVADVTGDGVVDLIATRGVNLATTLAWAPGLGGGAFGAWTSISGTSARAPLDEIALADFDADGDLDIAAADAGSLRAYVYWNGGAGTFTRDAIPLCEVLDASATNPLLVEAADIDADGLIDIAVGPVRYAYNSVGIFLRAGDNSGWRPMIQQVVFSENTTSAQRMFTFSDPDGDGDVDFLADRLVRNTHHQGDAGGMRVQDTGGLVGQGGVKPLVGADGPFRVGEVAQLRVRGLPPGASGRLVVWYPSDPAPPSFGPVQAATPQRIHSEIPLTASGQPGDAPGSGTWNLEYTVPGYSAGRTKAYTAFVQDDTLFSGESRSNCLYVTYGP